MITIEKSFKGRKFVYENCPLEQIVFFDIETTGFVADKSFVYLIGCCYYQENAWKLIQWFAENPLEEIEILQAFSEFIGHYSVCIHYNGTTFDIPYITRKCILHKQRNPFDGLKNVDLYRIATSLKSLLHLDSCTQKSVEHALLIEREDTYSGGELIQVYANYVGLAKLEKLQKGTKDIKHMIKAETNAASMETASDFLHILLLHNEDDLIGMQALSSLLEYQRMLDGHFRIDSMELTMDDCLCFQLVLEGSFPVSFRSVQSSIEVSGKDSICTLRVPLYEGTLNHYLSDYKNYYYLPYEDTVIHKSIAGSMDKSYRKPAKKEQCYVKKTALFLPQFELIQEPVFQPELKSKILFFECTDELLQDEAFLHTYTSHILHSVLNIKKKKSRV